MNRKIDKTPLVVKAKALKDLYPMEYHRGTICDLWTIALQENVVRLKLYEEAKEHYGDRWNKPNKRVSQKLHSI